MRVLLNARQRRLVLSLPAFIAGILLIWHLDDVWTVHLRDIGYLTRPIWDKAPRPFSRVIGVDRMLISRTWLGTASQTSNVNDIDTVRVCEAHQLVPLPLSDLRRIQVVDAILFSIELDLLELRLRELWDVVDIFLIAESSVTFAGLSKPLTFADNRHKFAWADSKIVYHAAQNLLLRDDKYKTFKPDPMDNEIRMRQSVSGAIHSLRPQPDSLIIMSDVDEMPSRETVGLLRACTGWGEAVHLGMPSYLYSFEYPTAKPLTRIQQLEGVEPGKGDGESVGHGPRSWRATIKRFQPRQTAYTHSRVSGTIFERAGWHCTFCFRYIEDFVFKMTSFSHNDRVTRQKQLSAPVIQSKICSGRDVFDMYPEAYSYGSLIRQLGPVPNTTDTFGLPDHLLDHPDDFRFLLPGGCIRKRGPP